MNPFAALLACTNSNPAQTACLHSGEAHEHGFESALERAIGAEEPCIVHALRQDSKPDPGRTVRSESATVHEEPSESEPLPEPEKGTCPEYQIAVAYVLPTAAPLAQPTAPAAGSSEAGTAPETAAVSVGPATQIAATAERAEVTAPSIPISQNRTITSGISPARVSTVNPAAAPEATVGRVESVQLEPVSTAPPAGTSEPSPAVPANPAPDSMPSANGDPEQLDIAPDTEPAHAVHTRVSVSSVTGEPQSTPQSVVTPTPDPALQQPDPAEAVLPTNPVTAANNISVDTDVASRQSATAPVSGSQPITAQNSTTQGANTAVTSEAPEEQLQDVSATVKSPPKPETANDFAEPESNASHAASTDPGEPLSSPEFADAPQTATQSVQMPLDATTSQALISAVAQPVPTTPAPPSPAVDRTIEGVCEAEVVEQIISKAKAALSSEVKNLTVQLDPPGLGRLHVRVSLAAGELSAQLRADNPATYNLIASHHADIREVLGQAGVKLDQLTVFDFGQSFSHSSGRHGSGENTPYQTPAAYIFRQSIAPEQSTTSDPLSYQGALNTLA